ncbi:hypothetical protein F4823DRAFT_593843 [Ustulina deusta]|nr:hypothetical protein F4823DRAFT_593843 [Ustulina deusta]
MSSGYPEPADDPVTPCPRQISRVVAASTRLWQNISMQASTMCMQHDSIRLSNLANLPSIPDNLQGIRALSGQASWEFRSSRCINPRKTRDGEKRQWMLTRDRPTLCSISKNTSFNYSDSKSNGIAMLFFGWSYILCATLLKKQCVPIYYTTSEVPRSATRPANQWVTVDIGNASEHEIQWWNALLTPGQGWLPVSGRQPVWAVGYTGNMKFRVTPEARKSPKSRFYDPPSGTQAAEFLSRFASLYNLESQAPLALSMALTLPLHNETNSIVKLPKPLLVRKSTQSTIPSSIITTECNNLSRYMTLSSNPTFLSSALWAVFWEPGIDCNLVSPWCDPIIDVVEPLIEDGDLESLGHVLALRQPNIAPLWYGIAACGQTKTVRAIVPFLKTLHTPMPSRPIPEVAAWTRSPQSFMDLGGSGPYIRENGLVAREDVWRLRHELWDLAPEGLYFKQSPTSPWQPFGSMAVNELELSVRSHVECQRHSWVYARWSWFLDSETRVVDESREDSSKELLSFADESYLNLCKQAPLAIRGYTPNHVASEKAVGDIFRWAATEMEFTGKRIYSHPWVEALADLNAGEDLESETASGTSRGRSLRYVKRWIENVTAEPE